MNRLRNPMAPVWVVVLCFSIGQGVVWSVLALYAVSLGAGMSVIAGHRDTHFSFLRDLLPGDRLQVTGREGGVTEYTVRTRYVVHKDRTRLAMDQRGLALVTCYPFDAVTTGGPLRYVVLAEPVEPDRTMPMTTAAAPAR